MSDLKLVSPDQPTPFEQQLLDAVVNESPSAEQRQRVRLALGLPAASLAPVPTAPVARRAWMLKAGGGLIVVSAAVALLLSGMGRKSNSSSASAASSSAPLSAPLVSEQAPAAPQLALPEAPPAGPAKVTPDSHNGPEPSKRPSKAQARASGSSGALENGADLTEQLRLIDAARSAVAAGDASAASAALTSYRTRFPRGPFGQEAAVLQIKTLDLQGQHAQAAAQARAFLARHPNSPHVSVVRRIAGP